MNGRPTAAAAGKIDVGGDLTVNRLGFGAMRITGPGIWGDPPDRDRAREALRRAVALDVTFIDTADSYGPEVSEKLIAETLYPYPENLVIATKGGLTRPGPGQWVPNGRPEHLRRACEGSLARLRLDRIDLYQFHRPDPEVPIAESIGALAELKDEGKIRHVGVSNFSEDQLREGMRVAPVVSVQNRYNVVDRSSEAMVDLCEQEMLVFLPWAPIEETGTSPAILSAARRHGVSERQVVLAWLLARSPQVLPIPGSGSPEHVEQNIAAASIDLGPMRSRRSPGPRAAGVLPGDAHRLRTSTASALRDTATAGGSMTDRGYPPGYYGNAEELAAEARRYLGQEDGKDTAAVLAAVAQVHATLAVAEAIEAALAGRRRPEIPPPGIVPPVVAEPGLPGVGRLPGL